MGRVKDDFGGFLFDILIILYLFLGGTSAGSLLVISVWSLIFHRKSTHYTNRFKRAFKSLKARCYLIGLIILVISVLCLIADLEYPERALLLFIRPNFTVITFGAFVLLIELLLCFLLALVNILDLAIIGGRLRKALEVACSIFSCAVMIYTGVFLANNASVPFWNTWVLVPLMFLSSLSTGISLALLIDYFIQDRTLLLFAARPLQKIHVICLVLEALTLALFVNITFSNPDNSHSLNLLLTPSLFSTALVGAIGMGIVVPFLLESYTLFKKECRTIPVSDAICLFGGLCLRYCVIMIGVH